MFQSIQADSRLLSWMQMVHFLPVSISDCVTRFQMRLGSCTTAAGADGGDGDDEDADVRRSRFISSRFDSCADARRFKCSF